MRWSVTAMNFTLKRRYPLGQSFQRENESHFPDFSYDTYLDCGIVPSHKIKIIYFLFVQPVNFARLQSNFRVDTINRFVNLDVKTKINNRGEV